STSTPPTSSKSPPPTSRSLNPPAPPKPATRRQYDAPRSADPQAHDRPHDRPGGRARLPPSRPAQGGTSRRDHRRGTVTGRTPTRARLRAPPPRSSANPPR